MARCSELIAKPLLCDQRRSPVPSSITECNVSIHFSNADVRASSRETFGRLPLQRSFGRFIGVGLEGKLKRRIRTVSGRPARASRSPRRVRHPGDTLPVPTHDLTYRRSTIRRSDDQRSDDRRSTINDQYSTLFSSGPLLRETCHLYCTSNRCSKIKLRTGPDVTHSLPVRILDLIP